MCMRALPRLTEGQADGRWGGRGASRVWTGPPGTGTGQPARAPEVGGGARKEWVSGQGGAAERGAGAGLELSVRQTQGLHYGGRGAGTAVRPAP